MKQLERYLTLARLWAIDRQKDLQIEPDCEEYGHMSTIITALDRIICYQEIPMKPNASNVVEAASDIAQGLQGQATRDRATIKHLRAVVQAMLDVNDDPQNFARLPLDLVKQARQVLLRKVAPAWTP